MTAGSQAGRRYVLAVEDSASGVDALEAALAGIQNILFRIVGSAEEALAELEQNPVAALITDINLPRLSGLDLIERLRHGDGRRFPILVVSGDPDPALPGRAQGAGADAFFLKPYSPAAVRRKLEELLHDS
jgi:CheY-like chemotaxis protein